MVNKIAIVPKILSATFGSGIIISYLVKVQPLPCEPRKGGTTFCNHIKPFENAK